jgi:cation:H+ antiporter
VGMATLTLLGGVLLAGLGGEMFVRGVLGFARWARIPAAIAAATLGAIATSSPELFVSSIAALDGKPTIGFGDATGSNVVNIALILALALLIKPIRVTRQEVRLDLWTALGVSFMLAIAAADGSIGGIDGFLLLAAFFVWLTIHVRRAFAERTRTRHDGGGDRVSGYRVASDCVAGLVLLLLAGHLVVDGARTIAEAFGIPAFIIGATLVALGTSTPELATTLVAQWRGHDRVSVGTLLGSNIFNGLFIVGITALITPIPIQTSGVWIALAGAVYAAAVCWPGKSERLGRHRGVALVVGYAVYLSLLAVFGTR